MGRYELDFLEQYTDDALVAELRRVAALLQQGRHLTQNAFRTLGSKVSHDTIKRRLGGWRAALERAGLGNLYGGHPVSRKMKEQSGRKTSDSDLITELCRVHKECGTTWLRSEDFNAFSTTSSDTIRRRFSSFKMGLEVAGIPSVPHKQRLRTDEQCFENLAAVWTQYGRRPMYSEMSRQPSAIPAKAYVRRWGTWRKAVKAFVEWANSDAPIEQLSDSLSIPSKVTPSALNQAGAECREVRPGLRFKVFRRDRFRCVACGRSPATHLNIELHADHIVSVADDGKTTLENLQTLCQDCNLGKGRTSIR